MTDTDKSNRMAEIVDQMADLADELSALWHDLPEDLGEAWNQGYPEALPSWTEIGGLLRAWLHALD